MASSNNDNSNNDSSYLHSCESCGELGFTDEQLRKHMRQAHVQNYSSCPFCDLKDASANRMMVHVNKVHLDFLSPESEIIDDSEIYEDMTPVDSTINNTSNASHYSSSSSFSSSSAIPQNSTSSISSSSASSLATLGGAKQKRDDEGPSSNWLLEKNEVGEGAVRRRPPLSDKSTKSKHRRSYTAGESDGGRLTRSLSNSPAHRRRHGSGGSTNAGDCNSISNTTLDSNCNVSSNHSSPSRSHLSLDLNSSHDRSKKTREWFASHRSFSTPVSSSTDSSEKLPPVAKLDDDIACEEPVTECPICGYHAESPSTLAKHINFTHFEDTPTAANAENDGAVALPASGLNCPFCPSCFTSYEDIELHVNVTHKDIISPCPQDSDKASSAKQDVALVCPVCTRHEGFTDTASLALHVESHYSKQRAQLSPEQSTAAIAALTREKRNKEMREKREKEEFMKLQAQYGMDNKKTHKQQYESDMEKAVVNGQMSCLDYHERRILDKIFDNAKVDDGRTRTKGLLNHIKASSMMCREVEHVYLCTAVDHYGSTFGDKGWGCGYRNIQMLLSSLQHHTGYYERLFSSPDAIPSIASIQSLIENAWNAGFDFQGRDQLGGKLVNTRKWIGATEVVALLSYSRIKCDLIDFHTPTGAGGTHPEMFDWCFQHFSSNEDFIPPLYIQHQGHSRTVIGCEVIKTSAGKNVIRLLIFDPSHSSAQMAKLTRSQTHTQTSNINVNNRSSNFLPPAAPRRQLVGYTCSGEQVVLESAPRAGSGRGRGGAGRGRATNNNNNNRGSGGAPSNPLGMLRRSIHTMKASQYQILAVRGVISSEQEYQRRKVIRSTRIPKT